MKKAILGHVLTALVFSIVLSPLSLIGQDRPAAPSETVAILPLYAKIVRGAVLDDKTNEPLAGVVIDVIDSESEIVHSVVSDENGLYELILDFRFDRTLVVSRGGSQDNIKRVPSTDGTPLILDTTRVLSNLKSRISS